MTGVKGEKNAIRQEMLKKRLSVPSGEKEAADKLICKRLISLTSFRFADVILLYSPIKGEPDITEAVEHAVKLGKKIAYPECSPETSTMVFRIVSSPNELIKGAYGIPEPPSDAEIYIPSPEKNDIIIVPAVCFDRHGYRIGYGKGYYDRFLTDFGGSAVGLTMSCLLKQSLPRGKYDKSVDVVITEKGVITA